MSAPNIQSMLQALTPEIYQQFKTAIEIRKWPNGSVLTPEQIETCIQAIIAYEHQHLPENERTGYVPPKTQPCADDSHIHSRETPLKWKTE